MTSIDGEEAGGRRKGLFEMGFEMLMWPALAGIGGYGALVSTMYAMQRSMMYIPHPLMTSPANAGVPEMAEAWFETADGLRLLSWHAPAPPGRPTVLFFHGNGGNVATRAFKVRPFLDAGMGVLIAGYRGYGANPGSPTEEGLIADARAAHAYLVDCGVAEPSLVYYGESLGSGVAVALAAERAPGAVVLEAPFTTTVDVARRMYWYLPVRHLMHDTYDSVGRIAKVVSPVLVLHGERDGVVPIELGRQLFEAAPEPKEAIWYPRGSHNDLFDHGAASHVLDFIGRRAGG